LGEETHLQFLVFIDFEELLETLFEDGVSERGRHDVEAASHFYTSLHFDDAHLIDSGTEHVEDDACGLRTLCTFSVKFDCWLKMNCVRVVPLDVQMRSNVLLELFADDLTRANGYCTTE